MTSVKQCQYPFSRPPMDSTIAGNASWISLQLGWLINYSLRGRRLKGKGKEALGIFNRPIIASTQILVHMWEPRTRILSLFHRWTLPSFYSLLSLYCGKRKLFEVNYDFNNSGFTFSSQMSQCNLVHRVSVLPEEERSLEWGQACM